MRMPPDDAIRARRRLTNKFIAAHDAARLRPFFAKDVRLIVGDGSLILGADAVIDAFAGQFADPSFKTYVRETERVEPDAEGGRAAEHGRWTAYWGDVTMTDEANSIDRVVLLRPAAVTHHFDYDQRYIELKINNFVYNQWNPTDVEIHIESPQEDLGPAGYYMLFALEKENGKRVPSEAVFIKLNPAI